MKLRDRRGHIALLIRPTKPYAFREARRVADLRLGPNRGPAAWRMARVAAHGHAAAVQVPRRPTISPACNSAPKTWDYYVLDRRERPSCAALPISPAIAIISPVDRQCTMPEVYNSSFQQPSFGRSSACQRLG